MDYGIPCAEGPDLTTLRTVRVLRPLKLWSSLEISRAARFRDPEFQRTKDMEKQDLGIF